MKLLERIFWIQLSLTPESFFPPVFLTLSLRISLWAEDSEFILPGGVKAAAQIAHNSTKIL